jgi:hypothetical protein
MASLSKKSGSFGKTAVAKKWHLTSAEVAGLLAVVRGIYGYNHMAAFIVGGLAVILAVEVRAK